MSLRKAAAVLPLLAALACAAPSIKPTPIDKRQTDVCNGAGGRSDAYDYNIPLDNGSGNVYYLCYNTAGGVTLTQEVADDTVTILQESMCYPYHSSGVSNRNVKFA